MSYSMRMYLYTKCLLMEFYNHNMIIFFTFILSVICVSSAETCGNPLCYI